MIYDENGKIPNHYRPSKITIAMFLASFLLMGGICLSAVRSANASRDAARADLNDARGQISDLQEQINCAVRILVDGTEGMLGNSIIQDDILLSATSGQDRAAIEKQLRETRAALQQKADKIHKTEQDCIK